MKKYLLFIVSTFISLSNALAQIDTDFWFAAPEVTSLHADRPIFLRISTLDQPAVVTISQPANSSFAPLFYKIAANSTISVNLTANIDVLENKPADQILNYGLHVESTAEITAYYEVLGSSGSSIGVNSEIFVLKGDHALGTSFFIPMQTHWNNNSTVNSWSSFDIVATQDNTIITITPTQNLVGHNAGVPYTVTLNRGQSYSARSSSPIGSLHPTGSTVTSNKPIAITMKDDSLLEGAHWDLVGDQLIPVNITGNNYIAIKVSDNIDNTDRLYICATQDNTEIFIDGNSSAVATINKGQTYEYQILSPTTYINTSNPAYVFHVCGFAQELGGAILPPIGCTGSRQVEFTRSTNEEFALSILIKAGYEGAFTLNGDNTLIPASAFTNVNGTGGQWKYAKIQYSASVLPSGSPILVKNDLADFQVSTLNGADNTGFRYGYFSDYGFLSLGTEKYLCKGDDITLNAGFGKSSYVWTYQNTGQTLSYSQTIDVTDSGSYKVTVTKGLCTFSDSVHISYLPPVTTPILGNDTAVCSNIDFHINVLYEYPRYIWLDSSSLNNYKPTISGVYWVDVLNDYGCKKRDYINITLYDTPSPQISYNTDLDSYCKDSIVRLTLLTPFEKYQWYNGDTTLSTIARHDNELDVFTIKVTDYHGCQNSDTATIDCSTVTGFIPNLITKNGDKKNDDFTVEYLRSSHWIMEVYNSWGSRVYYNTTYRNSDPFTGRGLSDDVYYYVLRHNEGKKLIKGWIQVISNGGN